MCEGQLVKVQAFLWYMWKGTCTIENVHESTKRLKVKYGILLSAKVSP